MEIIVKIFKLIILLILVAFLSSNNVGVIKPPLEERVIRNINADWQYSENNTANIVDLNANDWQPVNLPHTWNQWDAVDMTPGYRRDASWYQKELPIERYGNARYLLKFEGVNITSEIFVNGNKAAEHIGGYVGFEVDITKWVKPGEKNLIAVRVDNSYNPDVIPSQKADFFIYGGITRDVYLKIVPEVYIQNISVNTPKVSEVSAIASAKIQLNTTAKKLGKKVYFKATLFDNQTKTNVAEETIRIEKSATAQSVSLPEIRNPKLWSTDSPNLYTLRIQLLSGDRIVDEKEEIIGFRWFDFDEKGAFSLNGKKLLLRGTHRHEEHAGYGSAMPNKLHRKDITDIKEMGANFIRLGHYPQDPEVYKTCNELGIIVWDELPWCRGGMGDERWQANTERLFKEQIVQNYNHPSILFWSLGNEIYWLPDFENGDDRTRLNAYVKKLNQLAHDLDPNRMTSIRKYYAGSDLVDVFSPSIWSGWYAGVYTNYQKTLTENQEKYPRFLHMEYGGSSHVGRHTENPITGEGVLNEDDWAEVSNQVGIKNIAQSGDWTENYIVDLFDWYLGVTEQQENFAGNAQWAFKDFGTPLRPENAIPYINQKGLVDRDGKPKDAFYVFKSYWSKEPFTYIESHTWTERQGPKDKARNLSVFSNCETVSLSLNGKKLGKKNRQVGNFPACGLNWDVLFKKGKNQLIAHGYQDGKIITADTLEVNYKYMQSQKADRINLSSRMLSNGNYLIEAVMNDKDGNRILNYEKPLYFSQDGKGELLENYGTPTRSRVIQMANGYAAIELTPEDTGKAIIEARNQDFKGSYLVIDFSKTDSKMVSDK